MRSSDMMELAKRLYPITRSLTGDGVRETLAVLSEYLPMEIHEVPTGTDVLDWTVPKEWNISEAWIKGPNGDKVIDFADLNLHVVGYSSPVHARLTLTELLPHLHSIPEEPKAVPYRTSFYDESWGFCLAHDQLSTLEEGEYEVYIDATLTDGSLTYGEFFHPGSSDEEILLSSHVCHPSLANDNVSGMVAAAMVGERIAQKIDNRMGVRIILAPGTLGAITWLSRNRDRAALVKGGLTLVCLGDDEPLAYKRTVFGDSLTDRAAELVLSNIQSNGMIDFFPYGYDERQYNSPGFRMPIGSLMRSRHGQFTEYHTSLDNLDFISGENLAASVDSIERIVDTMDRNRAYQSLAPYGEPQLGRRGLYESVGHSAVPKEFPFAVLWLLSLSDGNHDLIDISTRSGIAFDTITEAARTLMDHDLLEELT